MSVLLGFLVVLFPGPSRHHLGNFERSDNVSLILDELGTVSMRVQEKILRVIEYGEFERVGGSETLAVDVRVVAATNEDLQARVAKKTFRADLLARLAFDVITVPPLRERHEDVLPLAHSFAVNMCAELRRPHFPGFSPRAASTLLKHPWPGNVRELKNAVERSVYRSEEPAELIEDIVFDPFDSPFQLREKTEAPVHGRGRAPTNEIHLPVDLRSERDKLERRYLLAALERANYNQKTAAGLVALSYHQFRARLKRLNNSAKPEPGVRREANRRPAQLRKRRQ